MKRRTRFWTSGFVRWICLLLVCALSLTLLGFPSVKSAQAAGQVYYVDNVNGRDTNNGLSESAAWQTITKVNSVSFVPGDQILFKRGEHWHETLSPISSGASGSPIVFGSYGSGNKPILSWMSGTYYNISVSNKSYLTFQGLECQTASSQAMRFITVNHIIVQDCMVTNPVWAGMYFDDAQYILVDSCTLSGCSVYPNIGSYSIMFYNTTYSRVHNNVVHDNGAGILLSTNTNYNEIDGNDCHDNNASGLYLEGVSNYNLIHDNHSHHNFLVGGRYTEPYGIGVSGACSYNEFYNNEINDNGVHGIEFWSGSPSSATNGNKVYRNKIYNNALDGIAITSPAALGAEPVDNEVYYNLIYDNGCNGFRVSEGGTGSGNKLYNNTIVGNLEYGGISFGTTGTGWVIRNNIVADNSYYELLNDAAVTCAITHDHNLYNRTSGNVVGYNGTGYDATHITDFEATALSSNPLFVDVTNHDFNLQSASPAINAGTNVNLTTDYDGNPISGQPDIGAFEVNQVPPTPTLTLAIPNGGESWQIGSNQTLQWSSTNLTGNVKLELSRDGGTGWETLFASVANSGSQVWAVSGPATTSARIKVSSVSTPAVSDASEGNFTLVALPPTPTLTLAIPNGGESWQIGSNQTLQWSSTNLTGNVKLELSRDGGTGWETLFASVANSGSQVWAVSGPATTSARIKVSSVSTPAVSDASEGNFTLVALPPTPTLTLAIPNGGESWQIGSNQTIQWSSTNLTGNVKLELSRDGGTGWETLFASVANSGSQVWAVSGPATTSVLLRITGVENPNISDISDSVFTLTAPTPTPPTSFTLAGRVTQADSSGLNGVTLSRSDGGGSVVTANGGSYSLTVPSGWSGQLTPSYSNGSFDPISRSYSNVSANQSGQDFRWTAPAPTPISFTLAGRVTQADSSGLDGVTLSRSDGGGSVVTSNGGSYSLTVPSGWSGQLTPSYSNGSFDPISRSYSNVSANQSGQDFRWTAPAPTPISFTLAGRVTQADSSGLDGVTLSRSDGGGSVVTANGGSYSLTVPSGWSGQLTPSYSNGSFDPISRSYSNVSANQSGQDFRWTAPAPTPISFTLAGRVTQADSSGLDGVTLSRSDGGGSVVTANGGSYSLTVPSGWSGQLTPSYSNGSLNSATVPSGWSGQLTPSNSNGSFDPVARTYTNVTSEQSGQDYRWSPPAAPSIRVLTPNGGESWHIGSKQRITWISTNLTDNISIELSLDGGRTWATLFASTPNDGQEQWTVTGIAGNQNQIRIISTVTPSISDTSDSNFAIVKSKRKIRIAVNQGWNLITTPVQPDSTADQIFSSLPSGWKIYAWDSASLCYLTGTEVVSSIGNGYWLYSPIATNLDIEGDSYAGALFKKPLPIGWNLIGSPSVDSYQLGNLRIELKANSYTYQEAVDLRLIAPGLFAYKGNQYEDAQTTALFEPGFGYWIKTLVEDCTLIF